MSVLLYLSRSLSLNMDTNTKLTQTQNGKDILLSPHGAQNTNLAFLPTCGGVLEFFGDGYWVPYFYGSLARSTGHYYYAIYTGAKQSYKKQLYKNMRQGHSRSKFRSYNMTVNIDSILEATQALLDRYLSCSQRGPYPFGRP